MPSRRGYILPTKFKSCGASSFMMSQANSHQLAEEDTDNFPSLEGTLADVCIAGT